MADDKRARLLDAVASIREVVSAGIEEGERLRTLAPATVEALAGSGLTSTLWARKFEGASEARRDTAGSASEARRVTKTPRTRRALTRAPRELIHETRATRATSQVE